MTAQDAPLAELSALGVERDRLLGRITTMLEGDRRVRAAWLEGSLGRGDGDHWSDLDLHIAVEDESLPAYLGERQSLYEQVGTPALIQQEMPANASPDATFQLVLYIGMIEVDWVIGPMSRAELPASFRMLVEREPVPARIYPALAPDERRAKATWWLEFFWAMAPIAVKYAGRSETRRAVSQLDLLSTAYIALWRLVSQPDGPDPHLPNSNRILEAELDRGLPRVGEKIDPLSALDVIRDLCAQVEALHTELEGIGVTAPRSMPDEVTTLAAIAEAAIRHPYRPHRKYR